MFLMALNAFLPLHCQSLTICPDFFVDPVEIARLYVIVLKLKALSRLFAVLWKSQVIPTT